MLRWGLVIVVLAIVALFAGILAQGQGTVSIVWQDYHVSTSVGVLLALIVAVFVVLEVLLRLWRSVGRASHFFGDRRLRRRDRGGLEALSRGLVAVASGDAETASRQARQAEALLGHRPLTMLLTAQAAQLHGDDAVATRVFTELGDRQDTEFLGLRGLLTQAMQRQDWPEALQLARRAYRLKPQSGWVVSTLYDLQKRSGQWLDAEATLQASAKLKLISPAKLPRERAELWYRHSLTVSDTEALGWAKRAFGADPGFAPAAARYAQLLIAAGKHRKAAGVIEEAWRAAPDAALAEVYYAARECHDALQKVQAAQRLAGEKPNNEESRLAVAEAALEARLWGEARSNLEALAGDDASPRVCRLMAILEEAEHGDLVKSRAWLMRAIGEAPEATANSARPPTASGSQAVAAVDGSAPAAVNRVLQPQ